MEKTIRGCIEGPRWSGIPDFLYKLATHLDLDIDIKRVKHIISETVYYSVTGDESRVKKFSFEFDNSVDQYHRETSRTGLG